MRRICCALSVVLFACASGSNSSGDVAPPAADAGQPVPDSGSPGNDGGTANDGGTGGDAGTVVTPAPDAGSPDAGQTDPPGSTAPNPHKIGGLGTGAFPTAALTVYGKAQGLLEAPVSASVDEGENLWVATTEAVYVLPPNAKTFRRFTAADGLHYGPGFTEPPNITLIEGGTAGECFVGYWFHDTNESNTPGAHTNVDPAAHMGKMDQVLLQPDGTLKVNRYDLRNSNDGHFYETRTVMSMVYDHFQHPGNLYVGSNHGITRIVPAKYFPPRHLVDDPFNTADEKVWYADHVHPWVCMGGPCTDPNRASTFGDWFGLTLADDGRLWMAGLTNAGALHYKEALTDWVQSWAPVNPFDPAFGDPYPGSEPVFDPPVEGDPVNLRGVAVTPDNMVYFISGETLNETWRGPTYGIASWDGHHFVHFDPMQLGSLEYNILEIQALADGRLVLGFPSTGLLVWTPGDSKGHRVTVTDGLPGEEIGRMSLDRMHDPAILFVPTNGGLAAYRAVP